MDRLIILCYTFSKKQSGKSEFDKEVRANMKKEVSISLAGVLILILGVAAWYNAPNDLMNLDPKEVMEIVVFNGNSGNGTHIEDKGQFQYSIDDLNDIGYTGYGFKMTIYLSNGNEADGWNNFIINSVDTIRKDLFFYSVIKGRIDYSYIENIIE